MATKQLGAEIETLAGRLEGRINRSREYHETLINTMRNEQVKLQSEFKSTVTGLQQFQVPVPEGVEGSVNHLGSIMGNLGPVATGHVIGDEMGRGFGGRQMGSTNFGAGGSGGGPGGMGGVANWKYRKLDMPVFDGTDPDGWILRIERYFQFYRLTEEEMMEASAVAMDGDALRWYQWENKRRPIRHWYDLKMFILRQFRSVHGGSLYEQWLSTTQTTSVDEYRRKFIETAAPLEQLSENILLGHFINGLKEEIKAEVRLLHPVNLEQAMEIAVRVEDKMRVMGYKKNSLGSIKTGAFSTFSKGPSSVSSYSGSYESTNIEKLGCKIARVSSFSTFATV